MFAYNHLQKTLQPLITDNIPQEVVDSVKRIAEKHQGAIELVGEYYIGCTSHVTFLQTIIVNIRKTLLENSVEFSQKGIASARDRVMPIFEQFKQQNTKTEQVAHAILLLVMDYINESPLNVEITLEKAPALAVLSVNVFLVGFASSLVAIASIQQRLTTDTPTSIVFDTP
jgi:septum formation topological specificity factor MinE